MMTTNIKQSAEYFKSLMASAVEDSKGKTLGNYSMEVIVHDRSVNINAASVEVKINVKDDDNASLGMARCTVIIVEKSTINPKTKDEFRRNCALVMNDVTHEIIWDKMSKDAMKQAIEYCFGYMVNTVLIIRKEKPMKGIKDYVRKIVDIVESADADVDDDVEEDIPNEDPVEETEE